MHSIYLIMTVRRRRISSFSQLILEPNENIIQKSFFGDVTKDQESLIYLP